MFFKKLFMDDSGALSYMIGCTDAKTACVVDPKRGVHEYIDAASAYGIKITHIFDTRTDTREPNGNMELKLRTGADLFYVNTESNNKHEIATEGAVFTFGRARIKIINSPCHNPFGFSLLVTDTKNMNTPWMVLHPHSLFMGDMGRNSTLSGHNLTEAVSHFLDNNGYAYDPISTADATYDSFDGMSTVPLCAMST